MTDAYIGRQLSIFTHKGIRWTGTLDSIDGEKQTLTLTSGA